MALSLGIKPLKLNDALRLYDILREFLPPYNEGDVISIVDFAGKILKNMKENDPKAFIDALTAITGFSTEEIVAFSPEYGLEMFIVGLSINDITGLIRFCRGIGYV